MDFLFRILSVSSSITNYAVKYHVCVSDNDSSEYLNLFFKLNKITKFNLKPCRSSRSWSPASHQDGPGSSPVQTVCDLWWPQRHCDGFSPRTSVPSNRSILQLLPSPRHENHWKDINEIWYCWLWIIFVRSCLYWRKSYSVSGMCSHSLLRSSHKIFSICKCFEGKLQWNIKHACRIHYTL
jgi:hypothetical protein